MSVSLKKRLVETAIRDVLRYAVPKNRPVRPKHRKLAAEALTFLLSDSCKAICTELGIDWHQTVQGLIHRYAPRRNQNGNLPCPSALS